MAITLMLALAAAFILSLTFVPAMVALLIRGKVAEKEVKAVEVARNRYMPGLEFSLRKPKTVIAGGVAVFEGSWPVIARGGGGACPGIPRYGGRGRA